MGDVVFFLLLGLGIGSIYAMLGAGIVVVYKGSGVINFAQGSMAMYGAFTFDELRTNGAIQLPWVDFLPGHRPNIPVQIDLGTESVATAPAILIALLMAIFIGALAHFLVFRPLRNAAPLGKLIGSLGVLLYLQGIALLNFGTAFRQPESVVPDEPLDNFLGLGKAYPSNALYSAGFAILIGLGLWFVYRYTRFGLATRAAASNEKGAVLLGYSPNLLAASNWIIASVVATSAAIVVGPIQGTLTPVGMTALVVPALGAALIGGLSSIVVATFGGLAIGSVQAVFGDWANDDWFPEFLRTGIRDAIPLVVIALVLFLRGDKLPLRGTVEERRLPLAPRPVRVPQHIVVWSAVVAFLAFTFTGQWAFGLTTALITAMLMLSIVVVTGYVGQISLAQLSLSGVAAFFMARMMADGSVTAVNPFPVSGPGLAWPLAAIFGIIAAVVVGLVIGLPALRIRGVQLAVVTLAAAISLQTLYLENTSLTDLRAGAPAAINSPTFFGIDIGSVGDSGLTDNPAFTLFCLAVLVVLVLAVVHIRVTGTGRRFLAVRANERAAAAAGVNVARTKLLAFGIAAALAGVSGVMLAFQQTNISSAGFIFGLGLSVLAFSYLGGITSINGAIVGSLLVPASLVVVTSNYYFAGTNIERYAGALGGLGLIITAILHPEGIAPFFQPIMRHAGNWIVSAIPGAVSVRRLTQFKSWERLEPTPAEVVPVWLSFFRRFGPTMLTGYVIGWIIWPLRVDTYSQLWMPLLGAGLALMIRSIFLRIYRAATGQPDPMHAAAVAAATNGEKDLEPAAAAAAAEPEAEKAEVPG